MIANFRYPCVQVKQESGSKELLLFSASAIDIEQWVGIPQRLSLLGNETAGFQRTVSKSREAALRKFFSEERNVIQNPLLCAIRQASGIQVTYVPSGDNMSLGHVEITVKRYAKLSLADLLKEARLYLEGRVPELQGRLMPTELIADLQKQLDPAIFVQDADQDLYHEELDDDEGVGEDDGESDGEPAEEALFDESQITEFWDQLRAREEIAVKLTAGPIPERLLGFSREMLESYLRPVILVDGQHRLRGATLAVRDEVENSHEAEELIINGMTAADAKQQLMTQKARRLPVSLLMDDSPAEHVFQYVLVNQKATPVPKALLGTIISTSLAAGELATIAERLEDAKIPLEGSRIVSTLSRAVDSPFVGLVAKGLDGDGVEKLQWSVLGSLAEIFRYLQGARLYHDPADHAKTWRTHHLSDSPIVAEWQTRDYDSAYDYWQNLNGPWIEVFKAFWRRTREKLANVENPVAPNYWGNPRTSNIFNKPILHILMADFFSYLRETKVKIESAEQISDLVDDWLEYASPQYFARDWKLDGAGVKKDSVGTRRQWSRLWANHRQNGGSPPAPGEFVKLYKV